MEDHLPIRGRCDDGYFAHKTRHVLALGVYVPDSTMQLNETSIRNHLEVDNCMLVLGYSISIAGSELSASSRYLCN